MKLHSAVTGLALLVLLFARMSRAEDFDTATTLISNDKAFTTWMVGDQRSFTKPEASMRHLVHLDLPRSREEANLVRSINLTVGLHGAFERPKPGVEVVVAW